ncbi:WD40 repeat protein [Allocatelliglobosispora scoriae]|uniref:WD40 repeat protein n=1 Tax=Allocatelliglobosispora scoriae TaxID=643052 RepID=A0A841C1T3_9ACTN|nr:TIR domain-containing protein [Allocatelliglobosispora scoriae]MBB5874314.1 WD40 repeat protein [Allocatelliglobosispora scoriae]
MDTERVPAVDPGKGYDAFISYAHTDALAARLLQRALRTFGKPWHRRHALRVFRDETALAAAPRLWAALEASLDASRYFVLLASPEAAASAWVGKEIDHWLRTKSADTILIALTGGDLVWDEAAGGFDQSRTTALPPSAVRAFPVEPLYIDLRWLRSHTGDPARDPRFQAAVADLAAPIHGRSKDEMFGEEVRQHKRTLRLVRGVIATLTVLTLAVAGAGVLFLRQRDTARTERDRAEQLSKIALSRALSADARESTQDSPDLSLLLGIEAYRTEPTRQGRDALVGSLSARTDIVQFLRGSSLPTSAIAFSPDGATVAAVDDRSTLRFWQLGKPTPAGRSEQKLGVGSVETMRYTPDGKTLALAGSDGLTLVDAASGAPTGAPVTLGGLHPTALAFSPDGLSVALTGCEVEGNTCVGGAAAVVDLRRREQRLHRVLSEYPLDSVAFAPDGASLAVGTGRGEVLLASVASGAVTALTGPATRHPDSVEALRFSADGRALTSVSGTASPAPEPTDELAPPTAMTWDLATRRRTGQPVKLPVQASGEQAFNIALSPDGTLVTAGDSPVVRLWNPRTGAPIRELRGHHAAIGTAAFSSSGDLLATGDSGGGIIVWRLAGHRFTAGAAAHRVLDGEWYEKVAADASGRLIAAATPTGEQIVVWDRTTGTVRSVIPWSPAHGTTGLEFSPDGSTLAVSAEDGPVTSWGVIISLHGVAAFFDTATGRQRGSLLDLGDQAVGMTYQPGGNVVAVATSAAGGDSATVVILDAASGARLRELPVPAPISRIAFSHDGQTLAVADAEGRISLWDADSYRRKGSDITAVPRQPFNDLAFSPDDRLLAYAQRKPAGTSSSNAAWHPVAIADMTTRRQLPVVISAPGEREVDTLAFNPDGSRLVGAVEAPDARSDGQTLIWSTASGEVVQQPLSGQTGGVYDLVTTEPGDGTVLVGADDNGVVFWQLDPRSWIAEACRVVGRDLTAAEWDEHIGPGLPYHSTCGLPGPAATKAVARPS